MRAHDFINEAPLPPHWEPEALSSKQSFRKRIDYAVQRALRAGAGSSRVAFVIMYEGRPTILKIAKNAKGIAQNEAEVSILNDNYVKQLGITIPLIDFGVDSTGTTTWLQTEVAQKATYSQLRKYFGVENPYQLVMYAQALYGHGSVKNKERILDDLEANGITPEQFERFEKYTNAMAELGNSFEVELGDFDRPQNWGFYQGHPVLIDVGFTTPVYQQHYSR